MDTGRAYVAALAGLAGVEDGEERRRAWRQGMAAVAAAIADRQDAPLEGLDPAALLAGLRVALADGLVADMGFLAPAAAAIATFTLASGLPPGPERRELGRRVIEQLDTGDAETFVALATALARASRRPLPGALKRARVAAALSAPLAAGTGADALALALLGGPELQRSWLDEPSTGSLPNRRIAARVLERAAREAMRRQRLGDDGGVVALGRASVRAAWRRLLADRETLVWRHAATARGLLSGADAALAEELDRELAPRSSPSGWRRGAASLAARIEVDPAAAARCVAFLDGELPRRDAGVVRGLLAGLTGVFAIDPEVADDLAQRAVERAGREAVEALIDLRHHLGTIGPRASEAAARWLHQARAADRSADRAAGRGADADDGHSALLAALAAELTGDVAAVGGSVSALAAETREALRAGRIAEAMHAAGAAAEALAESVEFLERADDRDAVDRRHALRTLRELDRELLSDGTVVALLTHDGEIRGGGSGAALLADLQGRLEAALLARESSVETAIVAHPTLRLARLRALVRAADADTPADEAMRVRERRLTLVRALLPRARLEASSLRRAVWAALTRAFDALLRDEQLELSDLVAGWTTEIDPDDDLAIAREAIMQPEVQAVLDAYASAMAQCARAADPDDRSAAIAAVAACGPLLRALGEVSSPRTDVLRANLAHLVRGLDAVVRARGQRDVAGGALEQIQSSAAVLADLVVGARRRLGLPVAAPTSPAALHAVAVATERLRRGADLDLGADATVAVVAAVDDQIPLVARLLGVALARLAQLPADAPRTSAVHPTGEPDADDLATAQLPRWLPASRTLGGFYVQRPLGRGAGGSVFVACRVEERHDLDAEPFALKVPDYGGGAARNLSLDEFEALFRAEAGALLAVPAHRNLARFVTFDAGARPKPILVMEYVEGQTLEQLMDLGELDTARTLQLIDDIAAGVEAMHQVRVAHLDLKPANVILRGERGAATPVLVDFGLAGRRIRPGCGSPHYGAPEVWSTAATGEPFPADVYALACLVYELLTDELLVAGETVTELIAAHVEGGPEARVRARLGRDHRTSGLAEILAAALRPRAGQRPTITRLRAGLAAIAPELALLPRPLS